MTLLKKICPTCVIVSGTWIVLLALRYLGYGISESFIAMLMGGSAVGISYALAKRVNPSRDKIWKLLSTAVAFAAMWALLHFAVGYFVLGAIVYLALFGVMKISKKEAENVEIKKQLENCC